MAVTQDFYAALSSEDRFASLRRAAERELRAGSSRDELTAQLEDLRARLRSVGRDEDDDVVLEVMDFVNGWCSPHMRL